MSILKNKMIASQRRIGQLVYFLYNNKKEKKGLVELSEKFKVSHYTIKKYIPFFNVKKGKYEFFIPDNLQKEFKNLEKEFLKINPLFSSEKVLLKAFVLHLINKIEKKG